MAGLSCPEEVDVFTVPHIRMKQLVGEASQKMSAANFQDSRSLCGFLSCLDSIFHEFKHHEEIENKCIMRVLQGRLTSEQLMSIVKEAHKHTHVPEILSLIKKGFRTAKNKKTLLNRMNYKDKLQKAVEEFQRDYLPHMKHEEEVFQPLLMEHFTFDELRAIKNRVIKLHSESLKENSYVTNFCKVKDKHTDLSSSSESCSDNDVETFKKATSYKCSSDIKKSQPLLMSFPPEVTIKIFSFLNPRDLCRSARVCVSWSNLAKDGQLWKELHPVRWIYRNDWRFGIDDVEACDCNCEVEEFADDLLLLKSSHADPDADRNDSEVSDGGGIDSDSEEKIPNEIRRLINMVRYLVPAVGQSVQTIKLGCCPGLTNGLVYKMLSGCPNVEHLDVAQTSVSDLSFKGLFQKGGGSKLKYLDVSGCKSITDKTLIKLASSLEKANYSVFDIEESECNDCHSHCVCGQNSKNAPTATIKKGLEYLALSGCYQITDEGLRALTKYGKQLNLSHLDLSGCLRVTAKGLSDLVSACPNIDHEKFFYCDNIDKGPYQDTASGCQNLECSSRVCCRSGL